MNKSIDELVKIIKNDGVLCVPTDTVYGLCTRINSPLAFDKLVQLKNRPANKSFPIMCADLEQIKEIAFVDNRTEKIINRFMPGPLTVVLNKKKSIINNRGINDTGEVGIRMAPTKELKELILKVGSPIFMTSANKSGEQVCSSIEEVLETFPELDGVLEGNVSYGKASTILDCTKDELIIQRDGPIDMEQIKSVLLDEE